MSLLLTRYIFVIFKCACVVTTMCTRRASFDDWREISELRKVKIVPRHLYALERRARSHGVSHFVTCIATEDIPLRTCRTGGANEVGSTFRVGYASFERNVLLRRDFEVVRVPAGSTQCSPRYIGGYIATNRRKNS